jgi:hypothetical protein
MRPQVLAVCLLPAAFATAAVFVACGGTASVGTSNPLGSREPAGSSIENPSSGQDPAPSSDEPPGTTGGGTNGTIPLCANPPADFVGCEACLGLSCGAVLSPAIASCSATLTCIRNCACSDGTCLGNCIGTITSACETALGPLETCRAQSCAAACKDISIGAGGDAGASGQNGSGTGTGLQPSEGGCSALSSCCSTLSGVNATECNGYVSAGNDTLCSTELNMFNGEGVCN